MFPLIPLKGRKALTEKHTRAISPLTDSVDLSIRHQFVSINLLATYLNSCYLEGGNHFDFDYIVPQQNH